MARYLFATLSSVVVFAGGMLPAVHAQRQINPHYTLRTTMGLGFEGGRVADVDDAAGRAYLISIQGLRILDLGTGELSGFVSRLSFSGAFAAAPELGRLFGVLTSNRLVCLDDSTLETTCEIPIGDSSGFTYVPEQRELYVHGLRSSTIEVYDAVTAERRESIELPGRSRGGLLVPGRFFIRVAPSDDLLAIDTLTKQVSPWPTRSVPGRPSLRKDFDRFAMVADPLGRTLFITTDKHIRAWDSTTGELQGEVITGGPSFSSYDPVAGVLLTVLRPPDRPLYRLVISKLGADGLTPVATQDLPANSQGLPVPTPGGFLTTGITGSVGAHAVPDLRHHHLSIWDRDSSGGR